MNQNSDIQSLQQKLGYFFKNNRLLMEALNHPSLKQYSHNKAPKDYERLEFLGDSVLNFIITKTIFQRFKSYDEGILAPIRAYLVCKDTICEVAKSLDLGSYIMMAKGEESSGGRNNQNNIENTMEAIIAAIYLDSDIQEIERVVLELWQEVLSQELTSMTTNYKSSLQEWSQSVSMSIPNYKVISQTGDAHAPLFKVMVTLGNLEPEYGEGRSIKAAEKIAAKKMLQREQTHT
jgi:ribonuclease-3